MRVGKRVARGLGTPCGFTLVELLVVIGIIAVLISILLPSLSAAESQARAVRCESNVRQLAAALFMYANENHGSFPPNQSSPNARWWYDQERVGQYINADSQRDVGVLRGIAVCPEDENSLRSYAMNIWASSKMDTFVNTAYGSQWKMGVKNSACMILIAEKWPQAGTTGGWWTTEPFGYAGLKPGVRFGGAGGISPFISTAAFGQVNCELPYMRHRLSSERGSGTQPVGRVSIGYADGHVALKRNDELVDSNTGLSLLDSLWSPKDPNINN